MMTFYFMFSVAYFKDFETYMRYVMFLLILAFKSRCSMFMDIFWHPWPKELYCDSFPDVDDPDICLGYKTAHETPAIEGRVSAIELVNE